MSSVPAALATIRSGERFGFPSRLPTCVANVVVAPMTGKDDAADDGDNQHYTEQAGLTLRTWRRTGYWATPLFHDLGGLNRVGRREDCTICREEVWGCGRNDVGQSEPISPLPARVTSIAWARNSNAQVGRRKMCVRKSTRRAYQVRCPRLVSTADL